MMQWTVSGVALLVAAVALIRTRRTTKRLERVLESYWDLRYELGQLQARVNRLEPTTSPAQPAPGDGSATFVPLSSLKR